MSIDAEAVLEPPILVAIDLSVNPEEPSGSTGREAMSSKFRQTCLMHTDESGTVRVYNYVKGNDKTGRHYYKCMNCVNLSRKSQKKYAVSLATLDSVVVRVSGTHHPECSGVSEAHLTAAEIDRRQRNAVRKGFKLPKQAYEDGLLKASEAGDDVLACYPSWKQVKAAYYKHA
ncbi:hypothetical protein AAVH_39061, partial [Aphelenchoides avenae]